MRSSLINNLYEFLITSACARCPTHYISLHLITLTIAHKDYYNPHSVNSLSSGQNLLFISCFQSQSNECVPSKGKAISEKYKMLCLIPKLL